MRRHAVAGLVLLFVISAPQPAAAWGFDAHRYILSRAIELLPPEIRPFFEKYRDVIVEHAIDPDLWRTAGWEVEESRHYVDMDAYGPYPFSALPRDYNEAVTRRGQEFVTKNGVLPWRLEEMYGKLVEAFTQKAGYSRENIKFFSSVVGHYAGDACVPFHAVLNHDGQLTGQYGIHARFESELFDRYRSQLKVTPGRLLPVSSARDLAFDSLTVSSQLVQQILDADRAAVAGREIYDDEYFKLLFAKVRPILEKRLADSITSVASLITSAWEKAGRPAVPLEAPRTPRKVRRQ